MAVDVGGLTRGSRDGLLQRLNYRWHGAALVIFSVIVVAHWAEHLVQAFQIWALGWARPESRGVLGLAYPWLVTEEWLHYGYALIMLVGLAVLMPAFAGRGRWWWGLALGIQVWHHFEHLILFAQAQTGNHLLGNAVPTSVVQLLLPRVELHLFYNVAVFIPMLIALYHHLYPARSEGEVAGCSCSRVSSTTTI